MTRIVPDKLLCPSAPGEVGALIIGVVNADGSVDYIRDRLPVTSDFLEIARRRGAPEQRFRFSSPCQQCACAQWADGRCRLPELLAALVPDDELAEGLPRCAIRGQCRWFAQSGARACQICPVVSTRDAPPAITERSSC
jgi:hypothetical protein